MKRVCSRGVWVNFQNKSDTNADKEGREAKKPKILRTSLMEDPKGERGGVRTVQVVTIRETFERQETSSHIFCEMASRGTKQGGSDRPFPLSQSAVLLWRESHRLPKIQLAEDKMGLLES